MEATPSLPFPPTAPPPIPPLPSPQPTALILELGDLSIAALMPSFKVENSHTRVPPGRPEELEHERGA
jgi:hypothetical protein